MGAKSTRNWSKSAAVTTVFYPIFIRTYFKYVQIINQMPDWKWATVLAPLESDGTKAKPVIHNFLDTCHHLPLPTPSDRVKACQGTSSLSRAFRCKCRRNFEGALVGEMLSITCHRCGAMWTNTLPLTVRPSWASAHYLTPSLRASVGYHYWSLWILMIPSCSINILSNDWYILV